MKITDRAKALGLLAAILAAFGLGGLLHVPAAGATVRPAAVHRCYAPGTRLALRPAGADAGGAWYRLEITNAARAACTLSGYPGVSFRVSPAGPRVGHAARRDPALPAVLVALRPGGTAHAMLRVAFAGNFTPSWCGAPDSVGWLGVYVPGAFDRIAVRHADTACPRHRAVQLAVQTVQPGA
jgi:hypothetical protein